MIDVHSNRDFSNGILSSIPFSTFRLLIVAFEIHTIVQIIFVSARRLSQSSADICYVTMFDVYCYDDFTAGANVDQKLFYPSFCDLA